jgi:hypothetical protein
MACSITTDGLRTICVKVCRDHVLAFLWNDAMDGQGSLDMSNKGIVLSIYDSNLKGGT